jgi:magnesium transporter
MQVLTTLDAPRIGELRIANEFFWLDLVEPTAAQVAAVGELFDLHPVVVEDLQHFGQRPKVDDYPRFVHVVYFGMESGAPLEVHLVVHGDALVTVRRDGGTILDDARAQVAAVPPEREEYAVHRVLDALTDSFFPALERLDDEIDDLEETIVGGAGQDALLQRIVARKREMSELRRIVVPQRAALEQAVARLGTLPGFTGDGSEEYFRDVDDHLARIADGVESARDVLTGLLDVGLSAQSYRLNGYITRLTVLGSVFLPLTFITGFFGQNFGWLVDEVDSQAAFWVLGIGLEVAAVIVLLVWFRRAGRPQ